MEMESGIVFSDRTLNSEISRATSETVESTMTMTGNLSIDQSCPPPTDPNDNAVGYFIFVVDNHDRSASVTLPNGVCRYGAGYWNVPPSCPFAACIDASCTQCRDWD